MHTQINAHPTFLFASTAKTYLGDIIDMLMSNKHYAEIFIFLRLFYISLAIISKVMVALTFSR